MSKAVILVCATACAVALYLGLALLVGKMLSLNDDTTRAGREDVN